MCPAARYSSYSPTSSPHSSSPQPRKRVGHGPCVHVHIPTRRQHTVRERPCTQASVPYRRQSDRSRKTALAIEATERSSPGLFQKQARHLLLLICAADIASLRPWMPMHASCRTSASSVSCETAAQIRTVMTLVSRNIGHGIRTTKATNDLDSTASLDRTGSPLPVLVIQSDGVIYRISDMQGGIPKPPMEQAPQVYGQRPQS